MLAVFQMKGPRFNSLTQLEDPVDNIHLYNMFCKILKITPAPNNGTMSLANKIIL
jgi:hypothetical protein